MAVSHRASRHNCRVWTGFFIVEIPVVVHVLFGLRHSLAYVKVACAFAGCSAWADVASRSLADAFGWQHAMTLSQMVLALVGALEQHASLYL